MGYSEQDAVELANNVVAMSSSLLASIELLATVVYEEDESDKGILLAYMSVLMTKLAMESAFEKMFSKPLEFQMDCLDSVKEIYAKVSE